MSVSGYLGYDPANPTAGASIGSYVLAGDDGTQIGHVSDALKVNIASGSLAFNAEYAEDSAHTTADAGMYILGVRQDVLASSVSADGDYGSIKFNAKGEVYTIDTDGNALLTTIDADTGAILTDTNAMVVDLAAIEAELLGQGTTLDSILVDTSAMKVDLAAIEVEQLAQGVTLDSMLVDTSSIDTEIKALSHLEDVAHVSGDAGIMGLAVRNDAGGALAGTDGDYIPLSTNATGELRVTAAIDVDDDLADVAVLGSAKPVSTTAIPVVTSALANRKHIFLANEGAKIMYIGQAGCTSANGFPLYKREKIQMRVGPTPILSVIGETGSSAEDLRVLELS